MGNENVEWPPPELLELLSDPATGDYEERQRLTDRLVDYGGDTALASFLVALQHPDHRVRWHGVRGLGRLRDPRSLGPLVRALKDDRWEVRERAALALGQLGDLQAVPALAAAWEDKAEDSDVREAAGKALLDIKEALDAEG